MGSRSRGVLQVERQDAALSANYRCSNCRKTHFARAGARLPVCECCEGRWEPLVADNFRENELVAIGVRLAPSGTITGLEIKINDYPPENSEINLRFPAAYPYGDGLYVVEKIDQENGKWLLVQMIGDLKDGLLIHEAKEKD